MRLLLDDIMGQIKLDFMINILHNKETEARLAKKKSVFLNLLNCLCYVIVFKNCLFINRHL